MLSSASGLSLLLAWLAAALAPVMLLRLVMASSFSWVTGPASVARLAQWTRAAGKRPSSIREAEGESEVRGGAVYSSWEHDSFDSLYDSLVTAYLGRGGGGEQGRQPGQHLEYPGVRTEDA